MTGKIIRIEPRNDEWVFGGLILVEDGRKYKFTRGNWLNKGIAIEDIPIDTEVEFELGTPNQKGGVYPQKIRFKGEKLVFQTKHHQGEFKQFIYIDIDSLQMCLNELVEGFPDSEYTETNALYRKIASFYNNLNDNDFVFSADNDVVKFPSGFTDKDKNKIYLYGVENQDAANKSKWKCDSVFCNGHVVGESIFNLVNAKWYDVIDDLKKLDPTDKEEDDDVFYHIKKRCLLKDSAFVWLKDGYLSTEQEANRLYVPTGYHKDEKELYLYCSRHKGTRGYGWKYDCITYENAPITIYDKKMWYELWAEFDWNVNCEQLKNQTLEESWSFGSRNDYGILKNYLRYTFARQWNNDGVRFSDDKKFAAFNTGLPDRNTYKYIYAFFEQKETDEPVNTHPLHMAPKYKFKSFAVAGRGAGDGKLLRGKIHPLPNPPQYFAARSSTVWELNFNEDNQITMPDYDDIHILIHRCDRLPLDFYRYPATKSDTLRKILDSEETDYQKCQKIREFFKPIVENKPNAEVTDVYQVLADTLDNVISSAIKKLSWNWRAVVPCYNPEREESCFLLPVSFCDSSKPDRAMIASVQENDGKMDYTIHTVISLEFAYLDARLVCRPESEWLAVNDIS